MSEQDKITFSKQVAETLGVECAIIYEICLKKKLKNEREIYDYVKNQLPFFSEKTINSSIRTISSFNLLKNQNHSNNILHQEYSAKKNPFKMTNSWSPDVEVFDILKMSEIEHTFIESKLVEYKIYAKERGEERTDWNTSFLNYIRREWSKKINSNTVDPFPINKNWKPNEDAFEILKFSNISKESALKYLNEFIMYWSENGAAFNTWNSKFINHVKRRCGNLLNENEKNKSNQSISYTKNFSERKADQSWAKEIDYE